MAILTEVRYEGIDQCGVAATTADGERRLVEADTVVIAAGATPARELAVALEGRVPTLKLLGDAVQPRRFLEAIHEGMVAGLTV